MTDFELTQNAAGRLVLTCAEGAYAGVVPVRAFPISAPGEGVSLLGEDGHELRWVNSLSDLPEASRQLLEAELADASSCRKSPVFIRFPVLPLQANGKFPLIAAIPSYCSRRKITSAV